MHHLTLHIWAPKGGTYPLVVPIQKPCLTYFECNPHAHPLSPMYLAISSSSSMSTKHQASSSYHLLLCKNSKHWQNQLELEHLLSKQNWAYSSNKTETKNTMLGAKAHPCSICKHKNCSWKKPSSGMKSPIPRGQGKNGARWQFHRTQLFCTLLAPFSMYLAFYATSHLMTCFPHDLGFILILSVHILSHMHP